MADMTKLSAKKRKRIEVQDGRVYFSVPKSQYNPERRAVFVDHDTIMAAVDEGFRLKKLGIVQQFFWVGQEESAKAFLEAPTSQIANLHSLLGEDARLHHG